MWTKAGMANGRHVGTDAAVLNVIDCTYGIT